MTKTVTKDSLQAMLDNPNPVYVMHVVGRALVVLFRNQTADEQNTSTTRHDNGEGFTSGDAYGGSLTAKSYLKHRNLAAWQVEKWTRKNSRGYSRLAKYHRQLNNAAEAQHG